MFPPTEEHPLRVEFWGDEVEEIRSFAVADQRTLETVDRLWALPCRELLLTDEVRARAAELSQRHPELAEMLDKLADGIPVEGMESLSPALLDRLRVAGAGASLHAARAPYVLLCDPERIRTRAHDLVRTSEEFLQASWAAAAAGGKAPVDLGAAAFKTLAEVRAVAAGLGQPWWSLSPFGVAEAAPSYEDEPWREGEVDLLPDVSPDAGRTLVLPAAPAPLYHGESGRLADDLKRWASDGWRTVLVFDGPGQASRAAELLRDSGLGARVTEAVATAPVEGEILLAVGGMEHGFLDEASRLGCHHRQPTSAAGAEHPQRTCARCPAAVATPSTRWSCAPGTTSCTSSTASAGTWRWCSAR